MVCPRFDLVQGDMHPSSTLLSKSRWFSRCPAPIGFLCINIGSGLSQRRLGSLAIAELEAEPLIVVVGFRSHVLKAFLKPAGLANEIISRVCRCDGSRIKSSMVLQEPEHSRQEALDP